jgi:hypothetical protein
MEWRHYQSVGTKRKEWKRVCSSCGKESWLRTSKKKAESSPRCVKCALSEQEMPAEVKAKISKTLREKYKTDPDWVEKVRLARNTPSGENHWNWKGGATSINQRERTSSDSSSWKLAVLHRDGYSCRICGCKDNLHAHHINSWSEFPEDRFILANGLTLCSSCHKTYHDYEREVRKNANLPTIS